jgi:hypothetical protein
LRPVTLTAWTRRDPFRWLLAGVLGQDAVDGRF